MDLMLRGEVAVVVGAASGIGRAIAEEFTREGAEVVWIDRDERVVATAASVPSRAGNSPLALVLDATNYDALQQAARQVMDRHGRCDHVAVPLGVGSGKFGFPFWNLSPDDWAWVLEVNLTAPVKVAHAFVPVMLPARKGTFCFLSSVAGQVGSQTDPPYSAAKAGLINFAQCAAKDLAPHNIRVNVVSPGMVKTPLNQSVWQAWRQSSPENTLSYDEWAGRKIGQIAPLGRWQEPEDVAALICFLASERAKNITGQTMNVDGGQVMH